MKEFARLGYRVGVFKPIETGVVDYPLDGRLLLDEAIKSNKAMEQFTVDDIVPIQFTLPAAPFVASEGEAIDRLLLEKALQKIETVCDVVLIEGAGGLMVPVDATTMMIDLITHFHAKALLVTHCRLGCINDTLLSLAALEKAGIDHAWTFNCREGDDDFKSVSAPYFTRQAITTYHIRPDLEMIAKALIEA